jgi:hypothetical protein
MIFYLKEDVISYCTKKIYAKKGDIVKDVADFDNCYIVEREDGFRFGVNKSKLSKYKIEKDEIKRNGK